MELLAFGRDLGALVSASAAMAPDAHGADVFAAAFSAQRLMLLRVACAAGEGVVRREEARFAWRGPWPLACVAVAPDGRDVLVTTAHGPAYLLPVPTLLALHSAHARTRTARRRRRSPERTNLRAPTPKSNCTVTLPYCSTV